MYKSCQKKIRSPDEVRKIVGPYPRELRVGMCHGCFDIVHPGHVRHLMYAKSKCDILIASVTADQHIDKGEGRPYVPQDLRAMNLASFEMIDYVVIDQNPTPIENIKKLQPDFFFKGFEYVQGTMSEKTLKEKETLESYGGKFVFSPGDIVYSSTVILNHHRPNLGKEKLYSLMESEEVTFSDLYKVLDQLSGIKVHVIGDTIVDKYNYGSTLGSSKKTPTLSILYEQDKVFVGGAGVVAKHLQSLGANVTFTTVVGQDDLADYVRKDLKKSHIKLNAITDPDRPTVLKERFIANGYKLLQMDKLNNTPLNDELVGKIGNLIANTQADIVVFSDFRHGLFHRGSIERLLEKIPKGVMKVADSQVSSRWGNILEFRGFDLITPNEHEARFSLGDQDSVVQSLAQRVIEESKAKNLILKLGEKGVLAYCNNGKGHRNFFHVDSVVDKVVDPIGAGDALLAAASMALFRSDNIILSTILGTFAAAVACEKSGNYPVGQEEIRSKIDQMQHNMSGSGLCERSLLDMEILDESEKRSLAESVLPR
jgi:rfaE bifunctional protein kinase chain/domain/rfaE bifunctional protein nucleotidyltransferase chain/domain